MGINYDYSHSKKYISAVTNSDLAGMLWVRDGQGCHVIRGMRRWTVPCFEITSIEAVSGGLGTARPASDLVFESRRAHDGPRACHVTRLVSAMDQRQREVRSMEQRGGRGGERRSELYASNPRAPSDRTSQQLHLPAPG